MRKLTSTLGLLLLTSFYAACSAPTTARMHLSRSETGDDQRRTFALHLDGEQKDYELSRDSDIIPPDAKVTFHSTRGDEVQPLKFKVFSKKSGKDHVMVIVDEHDKIRRALVVGERETFEVIPDDKLGQDVVVRDSELPPPQGDCGVEDHQPQGANLTDIVPMAPAPPAGSAPERWLSCSQADAAPLKQNIGVTMDVGEFKKLGSSRDAAQLEIIRLVTRANSAYYNQMNVVLAIRSMYIMEAPDSSIAWNQDPTTLGTKSCAKDINTTLSDFGAWQAANVYNKPDMAQGQWVLLTACFPPSGTVGLAWVGTLCDSRYGTAVVDGWSRPEVTFAHELGHNFGGNHAFGYGGIMDYGDGTVNGIFQFASFNKAEICAQLTNKIPTGKTRGCFENYLPNGDTTAPTVPSSLTASSVGAGVNLAWQSSSDNVGVAGYDVYRNGSKLATTANLAYADTSVAAATSYSYYVVAFDSAGNRSTQSNTASVTTASPDTVPPSAPAGLKAAQVSSGVSLNWSAATDNVGVGGYHIYRNGAKIASVTTLSYTDASVAASTAYSYTVAAYDRAGNISSMSSAVSITTAGSTTLKKSRTPKR